MLRDLKTATDLADLLALTQPSLGLPQHPDRLLRRVVLPCPFKAPLKAYFDFVGGFMVSPIYSPGAIEEFVDPVVPELQRRGRFRREYAGLTQRDHLGQDR